MAKKRVGSKTAPEKLTQARCTLLSTKPWYGQMALLVTWQEADSEELKKSVQTMGVCARYNKIYCYWNRDFVDSLTTAEVYGVIMHELEHLVRSHITRQRDMGCDPFIWNIAADMCINGKKNSPKIGYDTSCQPIMPFPDSIVWIEDNWPDNETAEYYYNRLIEENEALKQMMKIGAKLKDILNGDGSGSSGGSLTKEQIKEIKDLYDKASKMDSHDPWQLSDMAASQVRQLVASMAREAQSRAAGKTPGHISELIDELCTPVVDWRQVLRKFFDRHVGNRRFTYARRSRRYGGFGTKGISRHAAAEISVIVDTSGSISQDDLGQFFAEIESMCSCAKIGVLQWDHDFQGYERSYRRNDWKNIEIKGRGGTDMEAPVHWLIKNKLVGNACVMLTDGYCSYAKEQAFPMITCLCEDGSEPNWGMVVHMHKNNFAQEAKSAFHVGS
jgi:predicted metal-dependent peptidase